MLRYQKRYAGSTCSIVELDLNRGDKLWHSFGTSNKLERLSTIVNLSPSAVGGANWDFFNMKASAKQETVSWTYEEGRGIKDMSNGDNYIEVALSKSNQLSVRDFTQKEATSGDYRFVTMGGFTLVNNGNVQIEKKVFFPHWRYRAPRTAIGQDRNGKIFLVVVDGRRWNERGMNAYTLAEFMQSLGCVVACSGDGGGSSEMYSKDIGIHNRPSDNAERAIGGALLFRGRITVPYQGLVKYGSRGMIVKELQAKLGLHVDGVAGKLTVAAIRKAQGQNGLIVDGKAGRNTWAKLF